MSSPENDYITARKNTGWLTVSVTMILKPPFAPLLLSDVSVFKLNVVWKILRTFVFFSNSFFENGN